MEENERVLLITGEDRPGILDDVCGIIERNSGTVCNLRSHDLLGFFSMLVHVRLPESANQAMEHQLQELAGYSGLSIRNCPARNEPNRANNAFRLTASGSNPRNMLKRISHLLRVLSINVEHVETGAAPDGRSVLTLILSVPRECPLTKLREFVAQLLGPLEIQWDLTAMA